TNAGKSTLMTRLTGEDVYCADKLFATLDTKTSDFQLANGQRVLLSDTVGFIDKLPHHLVASFHATLEEVRQARLLLHVVDASEERAVQQLETVHRVLEDELDINDYEELIVFNKIDAVADPVELSILRERYPRHVAVSALTGEGVEGLRQAILDFAERSRCIVELELDAADGRTLAELARVGEVLETEYEGSVARIRVSLPNEALATFERFRR
ncbi:MAG: 50S ribosome-binding GTPase, partial [Planctomycetes bacterium]|nr:50S ribosome-binding GTPase [Planctomycetota bacterium]